MKTSCCIQIVKGSEENKTVVLNKQEEKFSKVQIHGLRLSLQFPTGKTVLGDIISFHALSVGLFLWKYRMIQDINDPYYSYTIVERLGNRFIRLSEQKIIVFSLGYSTLRIKDSSERYDTFKEAYEKSIIPTLMKNAEKIEKRIYCEEYKEVYLSNYIKRNFFELCGNCSLKGFVAKITEITRYDSQWQIKLTGAPPLPSDPSLMMWPQPYDPEGADNRKAIVILNDDYEVLEARIEE